MIYLQKDATPKIRSISSQLLFLPPYIREKQEATSLPMLPLLLLCHLCLPNIATCTKPEHVKFRDTLRTFLSDSDTGRPPKLSRMERRERLSVFKKSRRIVNQVNHDSNLPYDAEINSFSIELNRGRFYGLNETKLTPNVITDYEMENIDQDFGRKGNVLPNYVNWTDTISPPGHQIDCGSCWAFSAVGTIESAYYRATGKRVEFSAQEMVDCALPSKFNPCRGTTINAGFKRVLTSNRLASAVDYPYVDGWQKPCKASTITNSLTNVRRTLLFKISTDDTSLMEAVVEGVVSVAIHVPDTLLFYKSGVFHEPRNCGPGFYPNHAVNLLGYGEGDECGGRKCWILRNSWGPTWGERGYFRLSRDYENACSINLAAFRADMACDDGEKCRRRLAGEDLVNTDANE